VFDDLYTIFTDRVARARGMEAARVRELGEGRIWSGTAAVENGLVDRVATLEETIETARRRAGIPPERRVRVIEVPPRRLFALPWFLSGGAGLMARIAGREGVADPTARPAAPRLYEAGVLQQILDHPGKPLLAVPGALLPPEEEAIR
jgi:ClpP class serine protease